METGDQKRGYEVSSRAFLILKDLGMGGHNRHVGG